MKTNPRYLPKFPVLLLVACFVTGTQWSGAAPRHRASNPGGAGGRGGVGPGAPGRGAAGPGAPGRGAPGPGAAGRGVGAPGVGAPAARAAYTHTLPANYAARTYRGLNYYYGDGVYYYAYSNDGPTIYVPATVVDGVPTVPPRPYVYTLPAGYTTQTYGGATYYVYYGYYYYVYYINGRAVYVLATLVDGAPTVPSPPY